MRSLPEAFVFVAIENPVPLALCILTLHLHVTQHPYCTHLYPLLWTFLPPSTSDTEIPSNPDSELPFLSAPLTPKPNTSDIEPFCQLASMSLHIHHCSVPALPCHLCNDTQKGEMPTTSITMKLFLCNSYILIKSTIKMYSCISYNLESKLFNTLSS